MPKNGDRRWSLHGSASEVEVPEVGAGEDALHLAERGLDAERLGEPVAAPDLEHRLRLELAPGEAELELALLR